MTLREAIVDLVQDVGASLLTWRATGGTDGVWVGSQFHAQADRWAHDRLCEGLAKIEPTLPIVSEEDPSVQASGRGRYWLIDPIDGTASYAGGFAGYVTQIALMKDDEPVLAAVYAPQSQDLFVAARGAGACHNGRCIDASSRSSDSLVLIDNEASPRGAAAQLYAEWQFTGYVESGSIGLKICRVAEGVADVFFKTVVVRDWDVGPPHLILREAGGRLVDELGRDLIYGGGSRRHEGLVAARDDDLARRVVSWLGDRRAAGGSDAESQPSR